MEELLRLALASEPTLPWQAVALSLLLAFVLTSVVAQVYIWTHKGLSYSRSYIQALVLGSLVSATLMLSIGNNMARGLGILGTLAIIRFRSTVKDPRDMVFVFAAMAIGTAVGMRSYAPSVLGAGAFCLVALAMHLSAFGVRNRFDGLLRMQVATSPAPDEAIRAVLAKHCRNYVLVNLREVDQGQQAEYAYHVKLIDPNWQGALIRDLGETVGARSVAFYLQDAGEEV